MLNVIKVYRNNAETFYNYANEQKKPLLKGRIVKAILALSSTVVFFGTGKEFFGSVVTIYAILMGFSFSILFYLMSLKFEQKLKTDSIESELLKDKLNKLYEEVFWNISYFNLISVFLVFFALIPFLFENVDISINAAWAWQFVYLATFFYLFYDSIYSFLRTSERVFYLFEKKIELKSKAMASGD